MTLVGDLHEAHGATFRDVDGARVVEDYGRPERTHRAVRNVVGVTEMGYGVVEVTGEDRVEYVDNVVSNRVPDEDGEGVYGLLLEPEGGVRADLYCFTAGERLLLFTPPSLAGEIADEWAERTFIQDVEVREATTDFGVFGVHGPKATEKVASVFSTQTPDRQLTFERGVLGDSGATVVRTDGLTGEEGYEVVCAAEDAEDVFDTLLTRGMNAAPFGYRTWETLTLEAGTPLFATELRGNVPNVVGLGNAVDYEKGCFVGQEVVSRVHNRGRPSRRLVGIEFEAGDAVPEAGATLTHDGDEVGSVTRAAESPSLERPVALAFADYGFEGETVDVDGAGAATVATLPFVEGSDESARRPRY
ncbi:aminomethyltransferase family protein [Salinirubellus salinus]|uniref:Aminomethyltransferase family protein n=1 Tax=Salinirubellus salinus TaxID=1364945 RepID=A0A9E7R2N5_9EURY|nr:aminomethyltransferase family protein [Salinirubellus salinus]UWM53693.1 aminomethyltransferase family protein [Salinirubellus salinus]